MSNTGPIADKNLKARVIDNAWQYVNENFHKFTDNNKIKIVLAVISKDMPTRLEGFAVQGTKIVIIKNDKQEQNGNRISTDTKTDASI